MIKFACFSPHPPLLLPDVGSEEDREKVKKTINALEELGKKFRDINPDSIVISSPHPDWGFNVPLYFLAKDFKGEIKTFLTGLESPKFYFEEGKKLYQNLEKNKNYALIASGDLSHCLKEDGPYGFHPDGPKFDEALIEFLNLHTKQAPTPKFGGEGQGLTSLKSASGAYPCYGVGVKKKDIENFLKLDKMYPEAGECGLGSFSFLVGILESSGLNWQPEILSYEAPFGVGYLVAYFNF